MPLCCVKFCVATVGASRFCSVWLRAAHFFIGGFLSMIDLGFDKKVDLLAQNEYALNTLFSDCEKIERKKSIKTIGTYFWGIRGDGTGRVMALLSELWVKMGYNVIIFTEEEPTDNDYKIPDKVKRVVIGKEANEYSYECRINRYETLRNKIIEYKIDLFIDNKFYSPLLLYNALAVRSTGAFYCTYMHTYAPSIIWRISGMELLHDLANAYKLCDRVFIISKADSSFFSHLNIKFSYIQNPCLLCDTVKTDHNSHKILWVGRFANEKMPFDVIKAFKKIKKEVPDATLTMLGDGYLHSKVVDFAKNIDGITFPGFVNDMKKYYNDSDLFISTSVIEGCPLAMYEAQSYGIPIVAYSLDYLDIFRNALGIVPVEIGCIKKLASEVVRVFTDRDLYNELSLESYESFESFSSYDRENEWNKIFKDLINGNYYNYVPAKEDDDIFVKFSVYYQSEAVREARKQIEYLTPYANKGKSRAYKLGSLILGLPKKLLRR